MTDNLRTRIGAVQLAHMPDDYQRGMGECPCGFKYSKWSELASHVADAVIEALPELTYGDGHLHCGTHDDDGRCPCPCCGDRRSEWMGNDE